MMTCEGVIIFYVCGMKRSFQIHICIYMAKNDASRYTCHVWSAHAHYLQTRRAHADHQAHTLGQYHDVNATTEFENSAAKAKILLRSRFVSGHIPLNARKARTLREYVLYLSSPLSIATVASASIRGKGYASADARTHLCGIMVIG